MNFADNPSGQTVTFPNFGQMLDSACDRLWTKKAELSLRKIRVLEEELTKMEKELDEFIAHKN
jgi:hypothetical protein